MKRIEALRNVALNDPLFSEKFYYLFYKTYANLNHLPEEERYAESFYNAFSTLPPSISDGELIVGKRDIPLSAQEQAEWDTVYKPYAQKRKEQAGGGQDAHMAIDYELLLSVGINGIIDSIDQYLCNCNDEQAAFYNCCKRCLQAVIRHAERYAETAFQMSEQTTDPARKEELRCIGEICKRVPANPPQTFWEAVQSVHFVTFCVSLNPFRMATQQFQLGHPDRYLLPFYERDLQSGRITKEFAQLLLDCLGIQINMRVRNGLSSGYMVGGRDESGNIVANELTDMCMQVIDDVRLVYPAVGLCYTDGMPKRYLEMACALLLKGYSHPAIFGDDVITDGLMRYGVPEKQARNYIHSTCVEITPVASSNAWVASPYTNLPQLLLDVMDREYTDFDALLAQYFEILSNRIRTNFQAEQQQRLTCANHSINPLLSCFVNDCLKNGLDIERGGATYNWVMPSFVGMANLVDSLYAIKRLVFDEKRLTLGEFKTILDENFENNEALRSYIQNRIPKYGNDVDEIDNYVSLVSKRIVAECKQYQGVHQNADLIPSVFCWVMHEQFGRETSATPDGRRTGFPLGDGSGPCQGRELNGPTASILSSTKWDHADFIGGVAVNLKFSKSSLGPDSLNTVCSLVEVFLNRGGFEVQINVLNNETLKKAQQNPDAYRDLLVRIGGYSDYFVKLTPQMQEEIILRTAHDL